jgi:hypothetical protein
MAPCVDSLGGEASEDERELLGYSPSLGEDWNGGGGRRPWRFRVRELAAKKNRGGERSSEREEEDEGERGHRGGLIPLSKGPAAARITSASINDGHSATELVHCLEVGDEAVGWAGPLLGFG